MIWVTVGRGGEDKIVELPSSTNILDDYSSDQWFLQR